MNFSSSEPMNSHQDFTCNQQSAYLLPTFESYRDQTFSLTSATSSRLQPLDDPDLFATLLFDRQRAYQRPSSTLLAPHSSSQPEVRDTTPATQSLESKHGSQVVLMPPITRLMNEKQKRQVKGKRATKTLSAKPDTKPAGSRVARTSEVARETASREDNDVTMISSDEEEAQEIQQLRSELKAANARIKQLEDLLKTKGDTSNNTSIEQDDPKKIKLGSETQDPTRTKGGDISSVKEMLAKRENAPPEVTNSHAKSMACVVEAPLPLTPKSPPPSAVLPISPHTGSTVSNEKDLKLENVRATYTKVKRKLDTLNIIVRRLDWCTKSMDLSNFGEFGVHMKQLREWLEEDEQQQQQLQRQQQKWSKR